MRPIDADSLKLSDFQDFSNTDVMSAIDSSPTLDVKPVVHAHWTCKYEPNEDCMGGCHYVKQCSACRENYDEEYDYCPSCGADMRKEAES